MKMMMKLDRMVMKVRMWGVESMHMIIGIQPR